MDDLRRDVDGIARRAVGGEVCVDLGAGCAVQRRHAEAVGLAHVGEPDAGAPRGRQNGDPLAGGEAIPEIGEACGDVDHLIDVVTGNDPVAREHGIVGPRRAGEGGGVGRRRRGARFRAPHLGDDERLAPIRGARCDLRKPRRGSKALHEHEDHVGSRILQQIIGDIEPLEACLVSHADDEAEPELLRAPAVEEREADAAALRDDGDAAGRGTRRREAALHVEDRRAERSGQRHGGVEIALAVGAEHGEIVARDDLADGALAGRALAAALLGESRADDDGCANAPLAAGRESIRHVDGGDGHDGQIHGLGQRRHRRIRREPVDARVRAAHRIDGPVEAELAHRVHDATADAGFLRRRTHERDGSGPEKGAQIGHRRPAPNAGRVRGR